MMLSVLLQPLSSTVFSYLGESISLAVAVSWTVCALLSEMVSKRFGAHVVNVLRMVLSLLFIGALLWIATGSPLPPQADAETWGWLLASGLVGYVFGDYCLFNAYLLIGSRFGQLFMTIAPGVAALAGWLFLGETLSAQALVGMAVTTGGIAVSVLGRDDGQAQTARRKIRLNLPTRGVLLGIGAGVGQGLGLTLSAVGLKHYATQLSGIALPGVSHDTLRVLLPFAATQMRAVSGLIGFLVILTVARKSGALFRAAGDGRGMLLMAATVFFGPFVGVSLSLMATQYTSTGIAMTIMSLSPVLILWPAHLFFCQRVTAREVIGALISVMGVSLFFL